jgi:hypothetical protein
MTGLRVYVFFHIKVRVKSNVFFLDALQLEKMNLMVQASEENKFLSQSD